MKALTVLAALTLAYGPAGGAPPVVAKSAPAAAPNGLTLPADYRDWQVLGVSHRQDNNTLRVILGNDVAIRAARAGSAGWPQGSILAKVVWKDASHPEWESAIVPGTLVHAEFMFRDAERFGLTGGWGYARWLGEEARPFGEDAAFAKACHACHQKVANTGYVFTRPVFAPGR